MKKLTVTISTERCHSLKALPGELTSERLPDGTWKVVLPIDIVPENAEIEAQYIRSIYVERQEEDA